MRRRLVQLGLLASCACAELSESPSPLLDQAGDPCRAIHSACVDEDTARECIDGVWTDLDCEHSCSDRGPAMISQGCAETTVDGWPVDGCVCEPEPGACAPGATACDSDTEIALCGDQQSWTVHECDDLCAASLATPVSIGCEVGEDGQAACWCVAEA